MKLFEQKGKANRSNAKQANKLLTKQMQNKHVGNLRAAKQYRRSAKHKKQTNKTANQSNQQKQGKTNLNRQTKKQRNKERTQKLLKKK
jgi:hypothetical protein